MKPAYIREAHRLLRKSIIHVETNDIVLEDDEANDAELHDALRNSDDDGGSGGGHGDDAAPASVAAHPRASDAGEAADVTAEAAVAGHGGSARPADEGTSTERPAKKRRKLQLSYEEYQVRLAVCSAIRGGGSRR